MSTHARTDSSASESAESPALIPSALPSIRFADHIVDQQSNVINSKLDTLLERSDREMTIKSATADNVLRFADGLPLRPVLSLFTAGSPPLEIKVAGDLHTASTQQLQAIAQYYSGHPADEIKNRNALIGFISASIGAVPKYVPLNSVTAPPPSQPEPSTSRRTTRRG